MNGFRRSSPGIFALCPSVMIGLAILESPSVAQTIEAATAEPYAVGATYDRDLDRGLTFGFDRWVGDPCRRHQPCGGSPGSGRGLDRRAIRARRSLTAFAPAQQISAARGISRSADVQTPRPNRPRRGDRLEARVGVVRIIQ